MTNAKMRIDEYLAPHYDIDDDDNNNVTSFGNKSTLNVTSAPYSFAIFYTALALGIPGNLVSVIVWLRIYIATRNSSAVYFVALSINDLVYLLTAGSYRLMKFVYGTVGINCSDDDWVCQCILYVLRSASKLEPLIVLAFSVERLIAILRPIQV